MHGRTSRKHIASAGAYRRQRLKNWLVKQKFEVVLRVVIVVVVVVVVVVIVVL